MSVTVSIKVRRELVELADKMVKLGIARSRSHAFNLMIEKGVQEARREVEFWERVWREVEKMEKHGYRLRLGFLSRLLEEDRKR